MAQVRYLRPHHVVEFIPVSLSSGNYHITVILALNKKKDDC
jgi:hypothetical protein